MNNVERVGNGEMESDPLPDDEQVDERNARSIDGLTVFGTAFQMSAIDAADRIEAFVWTDKAQATPEVTGVSEVEVRNAAIANFEQVVKVGSRSGDRYIGVEFDHDTMEDGPPLMGSLNCPGDIDCSITIEDGEVTAISGYTFTGIRAGVKEVAAELRNDYLAFGIWLREETPEVNEDVEVDRYNYTFGAFADGGLPAARDALVAAESTATYQGSAAGLHSTASKVDFFYGKAKLTADFDDLEVTGRIYEIYAGGVRENKDIVLDLTTDGMSNLSADEATFMGRARMGTGREGDDGNLHYPLEGSWAANFYNPVADVGDTTTVMEDETPPGAAAGTFGVEATAAGVTTESYVGAFGAHKQ